MPPSIVVKDSTWIRASPEEVFDYTQDFTRRSEWDASIVAARVIAPAPPRRVEIRAKGGLRCVLEYRRDERPHGTSVLMTDVRSAVLGGGAGAWSYTPKDGGTLWEVTNSLVVRSALLHALLGWVVRRSLRRSTRAALAAAKQAIERPYGVRPPPQWG